MASANLFINCESEAEVHNKLMRLICCDYLDPESQNNKFQNFKLKSFLYLTSPVERCSSKPEEIWEELEKKGLLGHNNYTVLKKLVQDIDKELTYLIEDVEDKIKLLKGEDVKERKRQRTVKDEDTEIKEFQEKLCKVNNYETRKVPVSPLQSTSKVPIEDIFVPVCIREDLEYKGKGRRIGMKNKRTKPVKCPDDMFCIDDDMARNVFMLGDAGIGKSVFCLRLVESWCKAQKLSLEDTSSKDKEDSSRSWVYAMTKFDFLFFLQLRHVDKSRSSVIDMIVNEVFRTHPSCHDVIRRVLLSEKYRSIIVIDGVDEWKISDKVRSELKIERLPNTENMVNCTFLWSMRPWIMEKCSDTIMGNDRVVEIQGLDEDSKDYIIQKMLVNFYELDEKSPLYKEKAEAIKEKSREQSVKSIMKIPLMAIACIQIWYEGKDVGNSMTSLYFALLDLLIRRSKKKAPSQDEIILYSRNKNLLSENLPQAFLQNRSINEYIPIIIKLGKIAYDDLVSDETNLVFRVEDLEKHLEKYDLNIALEIGLLSKCEAPGICNEENVSINFFHKSMQEFLAAIYIANLRKMYQFSKHLSSVKDIMELGSALIFLSGINPMLGSRLSRHIVGIANADEDIISNREFNGAFRFMDGIDLISNLQVKCHREITHTLSHLNRKNVIPYHVSDIFVSSDHEKEIHRATADILTHHHADIRLLYIDDVPTDVENGIPDSVLAQYLDHTRSLQSLYIDALHTNRTLHSISGVFSSLTNLILDSITLPPDAICKLETALQSNTVIENLGLLNIKCQVNEDQGSEPASLSGIIQILPDLPSLSTLHIDVYNEEDKLVFLDALNRLSHLFGIYYGGNGDEEYDSEVMQTLCTFSEIYWLSLFIPNVDDIGVKLSHAMSNLFNVVLTSTNMSPSGWIYFIQSVLAIKHELDVYLIAVNIDEKSRSMIRSSPELKITSSSENDNGLHNVDFSRIWPKQLLYQR